MFCMLLRKHLSSGRLVEIRQDGFERILYFDFDCTDEMGDTCRLTLAAEIMGRRSNLILIGADGKILDSIKRVGQDMSVRMVLPGMAYTLPPRDARLNLFSFEKTALAQKLAERSDKPLAKVLVKTLEGISPVFAQEAEFFAGRGAALSCGELLKISENGSQEGFDRLCFYLGKTAGEIRAGTNAFTVLKTKDGLPKDFCFCAIHQYGTLMVTRQEESACTLLDGFFSERDATARLHQRAGDLFRLLLSATERITRRIAVQKQELSATENRDLLRVKGELITANLWRMEKGARVLRAENFYEDGLPEVEIALDERLTPAMNAQKYFTEYRKAAAAQEKLTELIAQGEQELVYLDSVFEALTRAQSENDIAELRAELAQQGYLKKFRAKGKPPKTAPPMKFLSSDGFTILAGRNNRQNDQLTCKTAAKTDIWLHTHNIPGAHVILSCAGKEPPQRTLAEAAQIAAALSKAKASSQVPVDYTAVKFVKKPAGARPGMVIFTNNTTLFVTPDEEILTKLKA